MLTPCKYAYAGDVILSNGTRYHSLSLGGKLLPAVKNKLMSVTHSSKLSGHGITITSMFFHEQSFS